MQRISTLTRLLNKFGVGKDGFKDGDLAGGVSATNLNAAWCNGVQEELLSVIEQVGITPSDASLNQLAQAVALLQRQQTNTAYDTGGTATAYTVTLPAGAQAFLPAAGVENPLRLRLRFHVACGANPTLTVGGTTGAIKQYGSTGSKVVGVITAGQLADVELDSDGTFVILDPLPASVIAQQPGEVCFFARNTAPTGFLKANGAAISRTTYAALYAAIGTTFGVGDGSTTFNLPDLRGEFVRGWDDSRAIDSGRVFGSWQADDFKSHTHTTSTNGTLTASAGSGAGQQAGNTGATGGTETRPRNIALLACIKY